MIRFHGFYRDPAFSAFYGYLVGYAEARTPAGGWIHQGFHVVVTATEEEVKSRANLKKRLEEAVRMMESRWLFPLSRGFMPTATHRARPIVSDSVVFLGGGGERWVPIRGWGSEIRP